MISDFYKNESYFTFFTTLLIFSITFLFFWNDFPDAYVWFLIVWAVGTGYMLGHIALLYKEEKK